MPGQPARQEPVSKQFGLPLDWPPESPTADFFVTDANRAAVRHLASSGTWPVMATLLTGPRKSGRSLLARGVVTKLGGRLFDNAPSHDEEEIFHAWNQAQATRRPLILIADEAAWRVTLPDLASRMTATPRVTIAQPDDELFAALMAKLLGARGLTPPPGLMRYLLPRIERSYIAIGRVVEALDEHLLWSRARLSVPTARRALQDAGIIDCAFVDQAFDDQGGARDDDAADEL